jgi:hypothetical protein
MSGVQYVCEECLDGREGDEWSGFNRDDVEEHDGSENCDAQYYCFGDDAKYEKK